MTAACSTGRSVSDSAPTAEPDDLTATAKADAIATCQAYWREMQRAYAKASDSGTDIRQFAAGPALTRAENDTKNMRESGQIITGNVSVGSPRVTRIDLDGEIPAATISSCLDTSGWTVVDQTTKKEVAQPSERLVKYEIVATVEHWPEGWKVIEDKPQGKAC